MNIKFWSKDELHKVLEAARHESIRNHCMILFAYNFGLRASELCGLTLQNVQTGRLVCQTLKGSDPVDVLIEDDPNPLLNCKLALQNWLRVREDSGSQFLFISRLGSGMTRDAVGDIFENAALHAGIERGRRNPHIAKHSLLALAYRDGCDVFTLQQLGHHKDIKATACYIHCSQDEARAKLRNARQRAA